MKTIAFLLASLATICSGCTVRVQSTHDVTLHVVSATTGEPIAGADVQIATARSDSQIEPEQYVEQFGRGIGPTDETGAVTVSVETFFEGLIPGVYFAPSTKYTPDDLWVVRVQFDGADETVEIVARNADQHLDEDGITLCTFSSQSGEGATMRVEVAPTGCFG